MSAYIMYTAYILFRYLTTIALNNYVQLKSSYPLSTHDVTHMRKCTRPSPA